VLEFGELGFSACPFLGVSKRVPNESLLSLAGLLVSRKR
jgi:hypothetical protein